MSTYLVPKPFHYFRVNDLDEALTLASRYGEEAKVIAGGQSLVPLMKFRLVTPNYLIDIGGLTQLRYIKEVGNGKIAIGALTTHRAVENSSLLKEKCPILPKAAESISGGLQVKNRGTIGGSVCHADPSAQYLPALLVSDAEFKVKSRRGERSIRGEEFFKDVYTTALNADEILTEILVDVFKPGTYWFFDVFNYVGNPIVAVSMRLFPAPDGRVDSIRIAFAGVASIPLRVREVEELLEGERITDEIVQESIKKLDGLIEPPSDVLASSKMRKHLAKVLLMRGLKSYGGG